jgi:hypothetical protein
MKTRVPILFPFRFFFLSLFRREESRLVGIHSPPTPTDEKEKGKEMSNRTVSAMLLAQKAKPTH